MTMIKIMCVDLDGFYFSSESSENFINRLVSLGATREDVIKVLYQSNEARLLFLGEMQNRDFIAYLNSSLNLSLSKEDFINYIASEYQIEEDSRNFINAFRKKGNKICLCSNNYEMRVSALDQKFNFLSDFDYKIFSFKIGYLKPNVLFFQEIINISRSRPSEIVYVDQDENMLSGSMALGINTILYSNLENLEKELKKLGARL